MKITTTLCAATALALILGSVAHAASITLTDASFESGISGTKGTPESGWFTYGTAVSGVNVTGGAFWGDMTDRDGDNAAFCSPLPHADTPN